MSRANVYRTQQIHYSLKKRLYGVGNTRKFKCRISVGYKDNKPFVLKYFKLSSKMNKRKAILNSMKKEVEALQTLDHPHLLKFYGSCEEGNLKIDNKNEIRISYFVMEYNKGITLFDYIKHSNKFSERLARYYFRQLISAIQYIHNENFIHRDIKLDNILIDNLYELKLIDFGLSCRVDSSKLVKGISGTKGFMPPELFSEKFVYGPPTDIFSCGVTLLTVIAGFTLFNKENITIDKNYVLFVNQNNEFWNSFEDLTKNNISYELKNLITRMLVPDPFQRISLNEIVVHSWITSNNVPTYEEVVMECEMRKKIIKENNKYEEISKHHQLNEEIVGIENLSNLKEEEQISELFGGFEMPNSPHSTICTSNLSLK